MTDTTGDWVGNSVLGSTQLNGSEINWQMEAGHYLMPGDADGEVRARVFHVAYIRTDLSAEEVQNRPVLFAVNGGPGSSSAFLHYGLLGPNRIVLNGLNADQAYRLIPNQYSILDDCDIVLLDPMSTGYTQADAEAEFHGVEDDAAFVADFIRWWLTRHRRWRSPRYLLGESYGGLRMCWVADHLQQVHSMYADGLILISPALSLRLFTPEPGEDLPYVLSLPTMALTAHAHGVANTGLDPAEVRELADSFALTDYASALLLGDRLPTYRRQEVATAVAGLIGIDVQTVLDHDLRIDTETFVADLFPDPHLSVGRYDTRMVGPQAEPMTGPESDISLRIPMHAYASVANDELSRALDVTDPGPYRLINVPGISPWRGTAEQSPSYLNAGPQLHRVLLRNDRLRVFVASGLYDLATPYLATSWFVAHLGLSPAMRERIHERDYPGGHMMFTDEENLSSLSKDLRRFVA